MLGLLELPAELRSMIYRLVIPKGTRFAYPVPITLYLGLFQSCRQLWHKEVLRELLCDAVVVHTLIGWHSLHDLVLSPVTPNISYLCIEIGMDLIQSLEDEHGVPFSEITPSYSRWLSEQQAGLAKWLGHFQSLRTLELKICFYRGDGKEVDIYIEGFFGSIDTSAEIIVSNGFGGSLGDGICLQTAEKLKVWYTRALVSCKFDANLRTGHCKGSERREDA